MPNDPLPVDCKGLIRELSEALNRPGIRDHLATRIGKVAHEHLTADEKWKLQCAVKRLQDIHDDIEERLKGELP